MTTAGSQPPPPAVVLVRKEHLYRFAAFCTALDEAIQRAGFDPDESAGILQDGVYADCISCGLVLRGEDVCAVARHAGPDVESSDPRMRRLHLGDCARDNCNGLYYRIHFRKHPRLEWPVLLAAVDEVRAREIFGPVAERVRSRSWSFPVAGPLVRRCAVGFALILLLLLARQWYAGGRIPLLREPEHFRVDPAPAGLSAEGEQPGREGE
jgi:hypothetical protein